MEWKKEWRTVLFLLVFILFILTKNVVFGILTLAFMLWVVFNEVNSGIKSYGWKHEVIDTIVSVAIVLAFWFGLCFILNTGAPISAVASCSMLPNLERGDMVIVQGTGINAYKIEMSKEEFEQMSKMETMISYSGVEYEVMGSMYSYCNYLGNAQTELCTAFKNTPELFVEKKGLLSFQYSKCTLDYKKEKMKYYIPCVTSVSYKGEEYPVSLEHDTIVYRPEKGTYFSYVGDIIHRAYFEIDVEGEKYYLTKGDNNPILDVQIYDYNYAKGNLPASNVHGKLIARIPYVGHLKLLLSALFTPDSQCNTQLKYTHE